MQAVDVMGFATKFGWVRSSSSNTFSRLAQAGGVGPSYVPLPSDLRRLAEALCIRRMVPSAVAACIDAPGSTAPCRPEGIESRDRPRDRDLGSFGGAVFIGRRRKPLLA